MRRFDLVRIDEDADVVVASGREWATWPESPTSGRPCIVYTAHGSSEVLPDMAAAHALFPGTRLRWLDVLDYPKGA